MSGGVDSSVAAAMLVDAGHDVIGITMKMHDTATRGAKAGCCTVDDANDARAVAAQLGIAHYVIDLSATFGEHVIDPFVSAYAAGRTPNPCVECNRHIKFTELVERADKLGIDRIATGHHARIDSAGRLRRGRDEAKDQSYVLASVPVSIRRRIDLPIGALTKAEVRSRADALGLRTANKAESMDVCFLAAAGKSDFLRERIELTSGPVVDRSGARLGTHEGAPLYTIGQRRGLAISTGRRVYVEDIDIRTNTVQVSTTAPVAKGFSAVAAQWSAEAMPDRVGVQMSAHGAEARADLIVNEDTVEVSFHEAQPMPAPGQLAAFYCDDVVIGGATIDAVVGA